MSYHYTRKKRKTSILFFVGSIFLLLLLFTPALHWGYNFFEKAFMSASKNTLFIKEKIQEISFKSRAELLEENHALQKENKRLSVENLRITYLESFLNKESELQKENPDSLQAKIISKKYNKHFILDKGEKDGVILTQPVLSESGSLLGFVSEVFDASAKVTLLVAKKEGIQALLFPSEISLDLVGNGNALLGQLPRDVELSKGDLVYSQNSGFLIGFVSYIDFDPRDPVKKIFVTSPESLQEIQFVQIQN